MYFLNCVKFDRYLQYLGYDVCYVRNFTDIDDKVSQLLVDQHCEYLIRSCMYFLGDVDMVHRFLFKFLI